LASDAYRESGVNLGLMNDLKDRIRSFAAMTHGPEVINDWGSFAGLYQLSGYNRPVLVASTDGVGTKLKIAAQLGHFESVGQDLVSLNVNDVLTRGAKPLFFLDYVAFSDLDSHKMDTLMRGITWGCREAGCALIGGETAQMPGMYPSDQLDLAGFVVGVVERDRLIDGADITSGDYLVGIPSSGVHTNGFSLVRRVFDVDRNPAVLFHRHPELRRGLGEELLIRHRCYYPLLEPVIGLVKGLAHITGGGLPGKMPAILPGDTAAAFQLDSWPKLPIFDVIQREGGISDDEMYAVFNMGLGMVLVCGEEQLPPVQQLVPEAMVVGRVIRREDGAQVLLN
jgi:phosphoribosylformylglycinamidine cyclo-ligase